MFALLSGIFFSLPLSFLVQFGFDKVCAAVGITGALYYFMHSLIGAALVEETLKFIPANFFTKKSGAMSKFDYMFLFGAVGLGFDIIESFATIFSSSLLSTVFRIACPHAFLLMFMGAFFYEYKMAKQNGDSSKSTMMLVISLLVPVLLHGMHDLGIALMLDVPALQDLGTYMVMADIGVNIVMVVFMLRMAYKEARIANQTK